MCVFAHGANPALCATNDTSACVTVQEEHEIEEVIAKAPEMILSQTSNVREYVSMVCEKINKCPEPEIQRRYLRELMESACRADFGKIEENVPETKVKGPLWVSGWGFRREDEIARQWAEASLRLKDLADQVWETRAHKHIYESCVELFEPYFMFIEKLKAEEQRLRKLTPVPFRKKLMPEEIELVARHIEFRFRSFCLHYLCESPDLQDIARFKERFRQVVGRPIRVEGQFNIDSRRRMENIIRKRKEGK